MPGGEVKQGLEGVSIGESDLGLVDGEHGELYYSGYSINDLVEHASAEETIYLLLHGELPTHSQLDQLKQELYKNRSLPEPVLNLIHAVAEHAKPMDVLRTAVSLLAVSDDSPDDTSNIPEKAVPIIAKIPAIIAATYRVKQGGDVLEPDKNLSRAANFLYMFHGEKPDSQQEAAVDAALTLYAEHGMNASTFAAVVTASTEASIYSALTSAVGALQGPLHGGATETVINMIEEVGSAEAAEKWVESRLEAHEKIPGFGHRVYQVTDPRCEHFKHHIQELMETGEDKDWFNTVEAVREAVEERLGDKHIWPNTDLYSGTVYKLLGIPAPFYTAMFALSRVTGWAAHVHEQLEHNRIIRPRVVYKGEVGREFILIDDR